MIYNVRKVSRAVWEYLNQSLIPSIEYESVWKPTRFWYLYKIRLLETCWLQDSFLPSHENQDEYRTGN
ncbi:hypothetical protein GM3708_3001 [Geminocystis sp. NIES-3708]|uniref:hypothetical protein n=1 Tax=Geminocystis sp. NIES-3708 TaxID=1615909 RepID=UPI0005FC9D77|nr:hypothetical protein [Geminocystis sp. NIES-3708]BAQ62595.1 hypothetical protein GM3708_3001 [Geminocystis sp. NIES-3708]